MQLRLVAFCYAQFLYSLRKSKKTSANNGVFSCLRLPYEAKQKETQADVSGIDSRCL
jgi:hypothetical protein